MTIMPPPGTVRQTLTREVASFYMSTASAWKPSRVGRGRVAKW